MDIYKITNTGIIFKFAKSIVAINPPKKQKKNLFPSTILNTFSTQIPEWTEVNTAEENQKIFNGAGEYEREGIFIQGISNNVEIQKQNMYSTSWIIVGDNIRIFVLGLIENKTKIQNLINEVSAAEILVIPVMKDMQLKPFDIGGVVAQLQIKRLVIIGNDESTKKEIGREVGNINTFTDKYSIKKKDLSEKETKTIFLN